jgi:hypothetical protein
MRTHAEQVEEWLVKTKWNQNLSLLEYSPMRTSNNNLQIKYQENLAVIVQFLFFNKSRKSP